jgi:hypothetical protein
MANPGVRKHLRFYPEDNGTTLSEAWQAERWLKELDSSLTTPMLRVNNHHDFYIDEPCLLHSGDVCLPVRWFTRGGQMFARAKRMLPAVSNGHMGWIIQDFTEFDVQASQLLSTFPRLVKSFSKYSGMPDPRIIHG